MQHLTSNDLRAACRAINPNGREGPKRIESALNEYLSEQEAGDARRLCPDCGKTPLWPEEHICAGCDAYRSHTAA